MKTFNFWGSSFPDLNWAPAPRYLLRRQLVLSFLSEKEPGDVVDIGTGIGAILHDLSDMGWNCVGVENSPAAFEKATKAAENNKKIKILSDLEKRPHSELDCLMAFEVLEHIEDDKAALKAWLKYLKPEGFVILSVPAHKRKWSIKDVLAGHYRRYERDEFIDLVRKCNCKINHIYCYGWPLANITEIIRNIITQRKVGKPVLEASSEVLLKNTEKSGIDRNLDVKLHKLYSNFLGKIIFKIFLFLQQLVLDRDIGSGYLIIAQKKDRLGEKD